MLHLIPARLQRALMPLANRLRRIILRMLRMEMHGVSVMAFDQEDRLLLVRHSYGTPKWAMPAGGMKPGEDPELAVRREVREELSVELLELQLVHRRIEEVQGLTNHVWLFTARLEAAPEPDMREVIAAEFFHLHDLPDALEKRVRPRLKLLKERER